jgi:hypothetical protein
VSDNLPAKLETTNVRFRALLRKAQEGDDEAMAQLRRIMDDPNGRRWFRDLAGRVRDRLIRAYAGNNPVTCELLEREMRQLRGELLGPAPTAVERLLAERVAIGWLQVHTAEDNLGGVGSAAAPFWQDQVDHAQRRFLSALRLLAAVRKLPRPAVQVNIAEQQVNVGG